MLRGFCGVALAFTSAFAAEARGSMIFEATAYTIDGTTASGHETRVGIVAADPDVLPLGTRIRVTGAGARSGVYVVHDTGRTIDGREIDIYMPSNREAKRFGRKRVQVEVLHWGDGARRSSAR